VLELVEAFNENRTLPREHFRNRMDEVYKFHIKMKWVKEIRSLPKMLAKFMKELHVLKYYDVEIWELIAKTAAN